MPYLEARGGQAIVPSRVNIRLQAEQVSFSAKEPRRGVYASLFSKLVSERISRTVDIYCPARHLQRHFCARSFVISLFQKAAYN